MSPQLNRILLAISGLGVLAGIFLFQGVRSVSTAGGMNAFFLFGLICFAAALVLFAITYRMFAQIRVQISQDQQDQLTTVLKRTNAMLSATKRLKNDQQGLIQLLNTMEEAAWIRDANHQIIFANDTLASLVNVSAEDLVKAEGNYTKTDFLKLLEQQDEKTQSTGSPQHCEIEADQDQRFKINSYPVVSDDGHVAGVVSVASNRTAEHKLKSLQEQSTYIDHFTNLGTRQLASKWLADAITSAKDHEQSVAVLYLNINDFKLVNRNFGPEQGDNCLKEVATRLATLVNENCLAARMSGDEFAVMLGDINNPQEILNLAQAVQDSLDQPIVLADANITVNVSMGMARFPDHGEDPWSLLLQAESDMQNSKESQQAN